MSTEDIIEKVQKLLALATSPNENEARSAAAMAHKLLAKYNLSMEEVEEAKLEEEFVAVEKNEERQREPVEHRFIFAILQKYFFVKIVHNRIRYSNKSNYHFTIVGRKHNVEIAKYVYDFLMRAFRDNFLRFRTETGSPVKARKSYYLGMYHGLVDQLKKNEEVIGSDCTSLVRKDDQMIAKFMDKIFGNITEGKRYNVNANDARAVNAGVQDGRNTRIVIGLTEDQNKTGILSLEHK